MRLTGLDAGSFRREFCRAAPRCAKAGTLGIEELFVPGVEKTVHDESLLMSALSAECGLTWDIAIRHRIQTSAWATT
jgi:hypothetical protein